MSPTPSLLITINIDIHAAAPSLLISIKMDVHAAAPSLLISIKMDVHAAAPSLYICRSGQFLSVHGALFHGEHSFCNMTDAIFIDINNSFIDINKDGYSIHLY